MSSKKFHLLLFLALAGFFAVHGDDENGSSCARNPKNAWLDLVVVIEMTPSTLDQNSALIGNLLGDLSRLTISEYGNHTTRIALVTYNTTATVAHKFTDEQTLSGFHASLQRAIHESQGYKGSRASIAQGLITAFNHVQDNLSNRIPGIVLMAATYENIGTDNPVEAANTIKANMINLATITFEATNGVTSPDIAKLATDGLSFDSKNTSVSQFGDAIATLNCVCSPGWTRLVINSSAERFYSDCFLAQDVQVLPAFVDCGEDSGLATVNTRGRLEFLANVIVPGGLQNPKRISISLSRTDYYSSWYWYTTANNSLPYSSFPIFNSYPQSSDVVAYLYNDYGLHWTMLSDDSYTNSRPYICQKRSCDTDHYCDRVGTFKKFKKN